jgi:hypothetical protein
MGWPRQLNLLPGCLLLPLREPVLLLGRRLVQRLQQLKLI